MSGKIKSIIQSFLKGKGYSIEPYNQHTSHELIIKNIFKALNIQTVIDVGANKGQYALDLLQNIGFKGTIYSFEPIPDVWNELKINSGSYSDWHVFQPLAIGDQAGEVEINITQNTQSSSLLKMTDAHVQAAPDSKVVKTTKVKVVRLDEVLKEHLSTLSGGCYMKVDTQGYEKQVLLGAGNFIQEMDAIELEVSLIPLYEGQMLFDDIVAMMKSFGFELWTIFPMFSDATGRTLQVDVVFLKQKN